MSYAGTMRYRVTVSAKFDGYHQRHEAKLRIDEIMDEAQRKLAALGYEPDVIIRDDDGTTPSAAEAALDEEERRRRRVNEILAMLRERKEDYGELAERVRQALKQVK